MRGALSYPRFSLDDLAKLEVAQGEGASNTIIDAVGPETFTFRELVQTIGESIGKRRQVLSIPPALGLQVSRAIGFVVNDVVLTRGEIKGRMDGLLYTTSPPAGDTKLSDYVKKRLETG